MVAILLTRDHFSIIFTSSKKLQEAVSHLAYLLAVTMVLNSVQPVISGFTPLFLFFTAYFNLHHCAAYLNVLKVSPYLDFFCRCCRRGWMASISCLYKLGLLLSFWATTWIFSWLLCKIRRDGRTFTSHRFCLVELHFQQLAVRMIN